MKKLPAILFSSKIFFFLATTAVILSLNLIPLIAHIRHSPPGRTFALIHNNVQDFFFYQSLMNRGAAGDWFTTDPYTTEPHQPSIIFAYFVWLGKLAKLLGLPYPIMYHLLRILLGILFLLTTYYLLLTTNIPSPRLCFFFFVFAAPFMHQINDGEKIVSVPYMNWWTGIDPIRRIAYLPHHMFGGLFLALSIAFIIKYFHEPKIKYLLSLIFISFLLAFVHTPSLFIILLTLPPAIVIYYVIFKLTFKNSKFEYRNPANRSEKLEIGRIDNEVRSAKHKKSHFPPQYSSFSPLISNFQIKLCASNLISNSDFGFRISKFIGLLIYWLLGLLLLWAMLSQTNRGFPWNQYISWEKKLQFPLDRELIGALGILLPLSIIGLSKALLSKRFEYILVVSWFISPFLLIPFAPHLNISNIRLIQGVPYLPLSILAVLGIKNIEDLLIKIFHKNSKLKSQKSKLQLKAKSSGNKIDYLRGEGKNFAMSASEGEASDEEVMEKIQGFSRAVCRLAQIFIRPQRRYCSLFHFFIVSLFLVFTLPTLFWSIKDQIREYWPIYGNVYLDNRMSKAFSFINQNFPKNTHTLSTFYAGNYLPSFTHTISYIGHFGYTYNTEKKQSEVMKFFENKMLDAEAKDLLLGSKIALIFQGPEEKPLYSDYLYPKLLKPIYNEEPVTLYVPSF